MSTYTDLMDCGAANEFIDFFFVVVVVDDILARISPFHMPYYRINVYLLAILYDYCV